MEKKEMQVNWLERFPLVRRLSIGFCGCPLPKTIVNSFNKKNIDGHCWAKEFYDGETSGYICLKPYVWDAEYPTPSFLHEYAHLKAGRRKGCYKRYHDRKWKDTFQNLLNQYGYNVTVKNRFTIYNRTANRIF